MAQSYYLFIDLEGFYDFFKERARAKSHEHIVYFLEYIIINQFSLYKTKRLEKKIGKCKVGCMDLLIPLS